MARIAPILSLLLIVFVIADNNSFVDGAFRSSPVTYCDTKRSNNYIQRQFQTIPLASSGRDGPFQRTEPRFSQKTEPDPDLEPRLKVKGDKDDEKTIKAKEQQVKSILDSIEEKKEEKGVVVSAATGTVNERLMLELEEAAAVQEGRRSSALGKKIGLDSFRSDKTEEEREAAIAEARDLNGVNPMVAIGGSFFALGMAAALWLATSSLGEFFATHPVQSDVYFIERVTAVFRNVVIGLISLASGFFGVTGMGIFLLGIRVAYGVSQGELDPAPLKKNQKKAEELDAEMPNVWDLMLNKKPGRRR